MEKCQQMVTSHFLYGTAVGSLGTSLGTAWRRFGAADYRGFSVLAIGFTPCIYY